MLGLCPQPENPPSHAHAHTHTHVLMHTPGQMAPSRRDLQKPLPCTKAGRRACLLHQPRCPPWGMPHLSRQAPGQNPSLGLTRQLL